MEQVIELEGFGITPQFTESEVYFVVSDPDRSIAVESAKPFVHENLLMIEIVL